MKYELQPYSIHELGQRENQEDSLFPAYGKATPDDRLFILCDGMGGHENGEVASATVCEVISKTILNKWNPDEPLIKELLQEAIVAAYDALDAKDNNAERKMGTTLTILCLHAGGATVAHIGDSRIYQFRPGAGVVFRTQDHSLVNDLIKIGEITEEEAKTHPQKNVITRAMQPHQEHRAKADIVHLTDIQSGDYFFLCSDGMLEQATDENLSNIITMGKVSNEQKVKMLRSVTEDTKDNHTAHLIYINKVEDGTAENTPAAPLQASSSLPNDPLVQVEMPEDANAQSELSATSPLKTPKKSRSPLYITIGIVALAIIAVGAFTARRHFSPSSKETVATDSLAFEVKADTTSNNAATASKTQNVDSLRDDSTWKDSSTQLKPQKQEAKPSPKPEKKPVAMPKTSKQAAESTDAKKNDNKPKDDHATTDQWNASARKHI